MRLGLASLDRQANYFMLRTMLGTIQNILSFLSILTRILNDVLLN